MRYVLISIGQSTWSDSSAKAIADLKKGELDEKITDADHRKAIINAAKRVLKVHYYRC